MTDSTQPDYHTLYAAALLAFAEHETVSVLTSAIANDCIARTSQAVRPHRRTLTGAEMRPELAQSDWPRHGAFRPTLRAKATIVGGARDCAVRHLLARIAIAMLISAAASSSSADAVRSGPAIALPYGDIIIPVPAPPSNADPMKSASPLGCRYAAQ